MIFCGLLMMLGTCIVGGNTNTVLPVISEKFGWDINFLRTMAGIGAMMTVLGTFVFGTIIAKKGAKVVILIALFATAACAVAYGFTTNLVIFIVIMYAIGFINGAYKTAGANTIVAKWWPTKKGIVLGFVTMGIPLMDITWQPIIPVAFGRIGVGPTMCVVAGLICILAIAGAIFIKNTPEEAGEYPDGNDTNLEDMAAVVKAMEEYKSPFTVGAMFRNRATFDIGIGMGLLFMAQMSYIASIIPRLLSVGYEYPTAILILMVCGGGVGIIGSFFIGALDQKFGTKRASMIFALLMLLGMVLALFHAQSIVFVWVAGAIFSFAIGGTGNLIPSYCILRFGRWDYASAYRVIGALTELLAAVGIMMTGLFHGNFPAMYGFNIVVIIIAFLILLRAKDSFIGKAD
jgi:sugar phosphate permease